MSAKYQFQFSGNAERDFGLLERTLQKRIVEKLEFFEGLENPLSAGKKLKGADDVFSFRVGDYRIIVTPKSRNRLVILLILKIGHRREVYE